MNIGRRMQFRMKDWSSETSSKANTCERKRNTLQLIKQNANIKKQIPSSWSFGNSVNTLQLVADMCVDVDAQPKNTQGRIIREKKSNHPKE